MFKKYIFLILILFSQKIICLDKDYSHGEDDKQEQDRIRKRDAFRDLILFTPLLGLIKQIGYAPTYAACNGLYNFHSNLAFPLDRKLLILSPLLLAATYALKKGNDYFWYGPNSTWKSRSVLLNSWKEFNENHNKK